MKIYILIGLIAVVALSLCAGVYYSLPKKEFATLNLETINYYKNPLKKFNIITANRTIEMRGFDRALPDPTNPAMGHIGSTIDASGPVHYEIVLDDNSVKKGVVLESLKQGEHKVAELTISRSGEVVVKDMGTGGPYMRGHGTIVNGVITNKREYSLVPFED